MTTTTRDMEQLARELHAEMAQTKTAAHDAIDADNPALAIALLKALRSLEWRAKGLGIALTTDQATEHPR